MPAKADTKKATAATTADDSACSTPKTGTGQSAATTTAYASAGTNHGRDHGANTGGD
jgi:hypothetical protein